MLRERYERDGYVICRAVLDDTLVSEAAAHVDWLLARHPDLRPERLHHRLVWGDAFWVRLLCDDRVLDCVEQIIGGDIALFASHYIAKPPADGQAVLWHQDGSYWPIEPMEVVTAWLAINPSTPRNGCMRVIPGSHRMELKGVRPREDVPNVLASEMPGEFVDEADAVDVVLAPGDLSLHHPRLVHGSAANTSELWRKGLTMRYVPTTTRINRPAGRGGEHHDARRPRSRHQPLRTQATLRRRGAHALSRCGVVERLADGRRGAVTARAPHPRRDAFLDRRRSVGGRLPTTEAP